MSTVPVTITITRTNTGPKGSVSPDPVNISMDDEVRWDLVSNDYADLTANIEIKRAGEDWPFDTTPPKDIKKDKPKKSGKPKKDAKEKTSYTVKGTVMDAGNSVAYEIDPDIIIIGRALAGDS